MDQTTLDIISIIGGLILGPILFIAFSQPGGK